MGLSNENIWIYNLSDPIPAAAGPYVVVGSMGAKPYGNNKTHKMISGVYKQTVTTYNEEIISVQIFSRDTSALERAHEITAAMVSDYSLEQQFKKGMKIAAVPLTYSDSSYEDGVAILYRMSMTFRVLTAYTDDKTVNYYDQFSLETKENKS
jgi:hypothetical protein